MKIYKLNYDVSEYWSEHTTYRTLGYFTKEGKDNIVKILREVYDVVQTHKLETISNPIDQRLLSALKELIQYYKQNYMSEDYYAEELDYNEDPIIAKEHEDTAFAEMVQVCFIEYELDTLIYNSYH